MVGATTTVAAAFLALVGFRGLVGPSAPLADVEEIASSPLDQRQPPLDALELVDALGWEPAASATAAAQEPETPIEEEEAAVLEESSLPKHPEGPEHSWMMDFFKVALLLVFGLLSLALGWWDASRRGQRKSRKKVPGAWKFEIPAPTQPQPNGMSPYTVPKGGDQGATSLDGAEDSDGAPADASAYFAPFESAEFTGEDQTAVANAAAPEAGSDEADAANKSDSSMCLGSILSAPTPQRNDTRRRRSL